MRPRPRLERIDIPGDMAKRMRDLARRRALPIWEAGQAWEHSIVDVLMAVYLQGVQDGYESAEWRSTRA